MELFVRHKKIRGQAVDDHLIALEEVLKDAQESYISALESQRDRIRS